MSDAKKLEISTVDQLTSYLTQIKSEAEQHLGKLESDLKGENINSLKETQQHINEKIGALITAVESNAQLLSDLHATNTEFSVYYNNLKASYQQHLEGQLSSSNEKSMSWQETISSLGKNKRALGAGITGASYGFIKGYNESTQDMSQSSRGSRLWKRCKGVVNGIRTGALYGLGAILGIHLIDKGIQVWQGIKNGAEFITSPSQRIQAAKSGITSIIADITGRLSSFAVGSKEEMLDKGNKEVADNRMDDGVYEIQMENINQVKLLNRKTNQEEVAVIPEHAEIKEALIPEMLDQTYGDFNFTDKYLLSIKSLNLWTSLARKRVQESARLTKQGTYFNDVFLLEQDIIKLQNMVVNKKPKQEIESYMQSLLTRVTEFENNKQYVIGPTDRTPVLGLINSHQAAGGNNQIQRKNHRDHVEASIYEKYTSIGGYGNSNPVANQLYEDLCKKEKYLHLLDIFATGDILKDLAFIEEGVTFDETLMSKLGTFFREQGFRKDDGKSGIDSPAERYICEKIIASYQASKKSSEHPETLKQIKIHFNRNFVGDIDNDKGAQQRMIQSYESDDTMLANIRVFANDTNYPGSLALDDPKRFEIIKNFARTMAKQQIIIGAVQSGFLESFFYKYLPTQEKDQKESLLSKIIGAGSDISHATISSAVDIGVNLAISLIPVMGAEFAIAKTLGALGTRYAMMQGAGIMARTARLAIRVGVGHTAMSVGQGLISHEGIYEMFDAFFSLEEFGKNALFFTVIGRLAPWLKGKGQLLKNINPTSKIGKNLVSLLSHEGLIGIGAIATEAAVLTGGSGLLDENHDWSRGEFMTVAILSLVLQSKVGEKIKDYKAIVENGKVKLVPKTLVKIAQGVEKAAVGTENAITKNSASLRTRYRNKLKNLKEGEETVINGMSFKKNNGSIVSGSKSYATIDQALKQVNLKGMTTEKITELRGQELGGIIESVIRNKKIIKIGNKECIFQVENNTAKLMKKNGSGKRVEVTETEIQEMVKNSESIVLEKLGKKTSAIGKTPVHSIPEPHQSWLRQKAKAMGVRGRDFVLGDVYPMIKNKKINFWQLAKGNGSLRPGVKSIFQFGTGRLGRGFWNGITNIQSTFTIASILYGGIIGDDGDNGFDEGFENYMLYHVLGRSIPLKILAAIIDKEIL